MKYLEQLSNAFGVSGDEKAVRKIVIDAIRPHVTDMHIDAVGNLSAFKKGTGESSMRVLLAAHMDEIGFIVTGYDNNGFIKFKSIGGVDDRILPALRVKIGEKAVNGVIMWTPIHKNRDKNTKALKDLRIDIGVTTKAAAEGKVKRGDRIMFATDYLDMNPYVVRGKAFDDRAGCSLLIDILQSGDYPVDIVAAFTVQEEIGLRGARILATRHQPDMAIVLETTTAHDIPHADADPDNLELQNPGCRLGGGAALTVMDRSMITPPHLLDFMKSTARQHNIPYQLKTALGGGTDAGRIHISNGGTPSMVVSLPCRYIHSPYGILNKQDYADTLNLVQTALRELTPQTIVPA